MSDSTYHDCKRIWNVYTKELGTISTTETFILPAHLLSHNLKQLPHRIERTLLLRCTWYVCLTLFPNFTEYNFLGFISLCIGARGELGCELGDELKSKFDSEGERDRRLGKDPVSGDCFCY